MPRLLSGAALVSTCRPPPLERRVPPSPTVRARLRPPASRSRAFPHVPPSGVAGASLSAFPRRPLPPASPCA
eukprot:562541-Pleurochrysis_carterae.AAC.1